MLKKVIKAKPMEMCMYPRCEECKEYREINNRYYCCVPMVISKQEKLIKESQIEQIAKRVSDLEEIVLEDL